MNEGEIGFCNLRTVREGVVVDTMPGRALVSWYFDPLPTNCVADWVCPATCGSSRDEWRGGKNLAVFYGSCCSDCLFCQNASYRTMMASGRPHMSAAELAAVADDRTSCVCYFGGDPACNPQHSLETSRLLNEERSIRVCYESNGNISGKWLHKIADMIQKTGGTFKFDLKAVSSNLYRALTGISNTVALNNFRKIAALGKSREQEFLVASVLLVPGYIGLTEVEKLAEFIASCDPTIPTALLGFHPHFAMQDLPRTSRAHAEAAKLTAEEAGLTNVRIGNLGLLSGHIYNYD
jgi:pyruvate formate lyase activating enzyme